LSTFAVFALNERESGAVTERMLQKQKQLRAHVCEVEQALRERQEDEVRVACNSQPASQLAGALVLPCSRLRDGLRRPIGIYQRAREEAMQAIQQQNETLHRELEQ
jgi:hypothetical protein